MTERTLVLGDGPGAKTLLDLETEVVQGDFIVRAKSDVLEQFFSALSKGAVDKLGGIWKTRSFYLPLARPVRIPGLLFGNYTTPIVNTGGGDAVNGMFLSMKGLKDGIEFTFPSDHFFSTAQSSKMFERLIESSMVTFFDTYLRTIDTKLTLTVSKRY